ncbi:MAG: HlyD family efflux transporter periplasmic adaptor subunit, partial [Pseudomonadota bacterium]
AAEARLERAQLNHSRTAQLAPFNGRVHRASVDAGQFVQAGQALASVFATDVLEVRMPLNARQLAQARLPGDAENEPMRATLSLKQGGRVWRYPALVVRSDSAIDTATRQLFVIAEVGGDSDAGDDKPTLKVGQFVEAGIEGRLLESVFVIPRRLLLQDNEVFLANQGKLERRRVSVVWQNAQEAVIEAGLAEGEILVMTTLGNATAGTRLKYPGAPN